MRSATVGNPFRTRLRFGGQSERWRRMLVALVQSIVGALDEYLSPLDKAGRQETSHHANDDLLIKRRVHRQLYAAEAVPLTWTLTRNPIARFS
jgi:hypothetical protein